MSDFNLKREVHYREIIDDYILRLNESESAWDKARAITLQNSLPDIPFITQRGIAKLIQHGWDFIAMENITYKASKGDSVVMVKGTEYDPSYYTKGVVLNSEGKIVKSHSLKEHLMYSYPNWPEVNMDVDKFLDLQNALKGLDQADAQAIENL